MDMSDFEGLDNGQKVKIVLTDKFIYTGFIQQLKDDHLVFEDKFGDHILVKYDNIGKVVVKRGEGDEHDKFQRL